MEMIEKIMDLLEKEITLTMRSDEEYYKDYRFILSNEQQYAKDKNREKGAIYIVVKFSPATVNFGQIVCSVTINVMSEKNNIEVAQRLLIDLALNYNLTKDDSGTIMQTFSTPTVVSNFNDVYEGYRSLMYSTATFLISENSNPFELFFYNNTVEGQEAKWEKIDAITSIFDLNIALDPQPFFSTDGHTKSVGKMGTLTLNVVAYLTDNAFMNECLKIGIKQKTTGVNTPLKLKVVWKNGLSYENNDFKLASFHNPQDVGQLPVVSITITE